MILTAKMKTQKRSDGLPEGRLQDTGVLTLVLDDDDYPFVTFIDKDNIDKEPRVFKVDKRNLKTVLKRLLGD